MFQFPTVWVDNTPDTLLDITLRYLISHQHVFCKFNEMTEEFDELLDDLSLPFGICERLLNLSKTKVPEDRFNTFFAIFKDPTRTHLRHIDLSDSVIDDQSLQILAKYNIAELNISNCKKLTRNCLPYIAKLQNSLISLNIGRSTQIFQVEDDSNSQSVTKTLNTNDSCILFFCSLDPHNNEANQSTTPAQALELCFPFLRKLVINGLKTKYNGFFSRIIKNTEYLTYLDLSNCDLNSDDLDSLSAQKQLTSLTLCDVVSVAHNVPAICKLTSLRHLDISQTSEVAMFFATPNKALKNIVESLEHLVSLDISGTNLAGRRTRERESPESEPTKDGENLTDIPGLASRVNRPLEFLGLLNTAHEACYRVHIPAKRIAGDAREEQILIAGQVYAAREQMIQKVLNDLFQIFRFSSCRNIRLALDVVMEAMRLHPKIKNIQVSGSASLFYIVKGDVKQFFNPIMRRKIIKVLLDAMCSHFSDETMLRNACLTLIHFKIPEDVYFDYERLVSLLLLIVGPSERQEEFVQRIGLYLLNSLACQVDGFNKKLVGDRGAITIMLQLIEQRLENNVCDEVMETAWSTMWNVTDETPINCTRFLEGRGMDLFLRCLQTFPEKSELLRNMMGLLGNVAEVKELRPHLMKDEYLSVFSELLDSKSDGIEVSYNAAGILSHIASDGEGAWARHNIVAVRRKDVLSKMVNAIEKWDLVAKRNINYRSFEPILRLLNIEHTAAVQHWAVWALANLTKVYPEKYCSLLQEEGGIDMLKTLIMKPNSSRILELAEMIIKQCERFESGESEDCDFDEIIELEES